MNGRIVLEIEYTVSAHPPTVDQWAHIIDGGVRVACHWGALDDDDLRLSHVEEVTFVTKEVQIRG